MGVAALTLISNPGSASRKYALYQGAHCLTRLHFEYASSAVVCTLHRGDKHREIPVDIVDLEAVAGCVMRLLCQENIVQHGEPVGAIGLRIVAPSAYFLRNRIIDHEAVAKLEAMERRAPLHIRAILGELRELQKQFPQAQMVGISDSAFHATKTEAAWNYGIPLRDADQFDVKRFGYHGLAGASAVRVLHKAEKLPPKVILCHLGSGVSVMAVHGGKSADTTMGYSPLEGAIMATRAGTIDPTAVTVLREVMALDDMAMQVYLNKHSGLLGLSGRSSDIRELLQFEQEGDHYSSLALQTYVHNVQKAIGQMAAVLGGADLLAFTGTVGERSSVMRERITRNLHYLDFFLESRVNKQTIGKEGVVCISKLAHSKPVFVVPIDESAEMAREVQEIL